MITDAKIRRALGKDAEQIARARKMLAYAAAIRRMEREGQMALSGGARPKACPSFDQQEQRRCQHTTHRDDVRDDAKSKPASLHEAKLPYIAASHSTKG